MADHEDELAANKTAGFNVGEKKTLEEYKQLGKIYITSSFIVGKVGSCAFECCVRCVGLALAMRVCVLPDRE